MSEMRFDGRVAVVTGAGGGLGREYALLLAKRGAKVLVNDLGSDGGGRGANTAMAQAVVDEIRAFGGITLANGDSVATTAGADAIVQQALDLGTDRYPDQQRRRGPRRQPRDTHR